MQIAAIDGDDLANDGGKASITWLCENFYAEHELNSTIVGWPTTTMRSWLVSNVLAAIPDAIRNRIVPVRKTYYDATSSSVKTSDDSIWIPSTREVCFTGTYQKENAGVQYNELFTNNASRVKYSVHNTSNAWTLRSDYNASSSSFVKSDGSFTNFSPAYRGGVVFGFCF